MGNKGTLMANGSGQGHKVRIEESDTSEFEVGSIYDFREGSAEGIDVYFLCDFSIDSNEIVIKPTIWRARGEVVSVDNDVKMKVTYVNDTAMECGETYFGSSCNLQGERTSESITFLPGDTRYRFSYDTLNGTVDVDSIEDDPGNPENFPTEECS